MKNSSLFLGLTAICFASRVTLGTDVAISIMQGALAGIAIYYVRKEWRQRQ